jgi:hypothetical protein
MINVRSGREKVYHINILISKLILIGLVSKVDATVKYLVPVGTLFGKVSGSIFLGNIGPPGWGEGRSQSMEEKNQGRSLLSRGGSGEVDK